MSTAFVFSARRVIIGAVVVFSTVPSDAAFTAYVGSVDAQTAWRLNAGSFVVETFQSFSAGTAIASLPNLGLTFQPLAGGGQPSIYDHSVDDTPSGTLQLANFSGPCCGAAYRFNDVVINVDQSTTIRAFGFWNGDPQGSATLRVYDRSDNLLGIVTASTNVGSQPNLSESFAGFISSQTVGRLVFQGQTGDG